MPFLRGFTNCDLLLCCFRKEKKCNAVANSTPNHINLQFSVAKNGPPKNIINTKSTIIEYLETFF